jgi:hypothetical protein
MLPTAGVAARLVPEPLGQGGITGPWVGLQPGKAPGQIREGVLIRPEARGQLFTRKRVDTGAPARARGEYATIEVLPRRLRK